jgi:hypothetical protein
MIKYFLIISILTLLNSCNKIAKISSKYNGLTVVLVKPCILVPRREDISPLVGETHQLLINDGNIANPDFLLQKGDSVVIEQVYDIVSDARGSWIGAKGYWIDKKNNKIEFIYCWSKVNILEQAPWESDMPENNIRRVPQDVP